MYIRITKNSKGEGYYHLMESYWEDGQCKKRMLLSLGKVGEDKLDELAKAISKHRDLMTVTQMAKEISVEQTFILGPLLVLEKIFELTGVNGVVKEILSGHDRIEFDLQKILFTMVVCRFVRPGSKLKIFEHWQKAFYPEMLEPELELHQIYRALDLLADHKEDIEKFLYWQDRDLLTAKTDIVLYDLTTLRFESTKETENLRRFGYSKEMRTDCTQVVFGLLLNTDGIPLGFEVYPGNTFEGNTLADIVTKLKNKFQVGRIVFVADRGLFSAKNLELLRADGGEFIVGHRLGSLKSNQSEAIYDLNNFTWIIDDELAVFETTTEEGDRLIVTWSRVRAERDAKTRDDILEKIKKKLSKKSVDSKAFVSNKNYQKYLTGLDDGKPELNEKAIEGQAHKDGFFGIVTNVKDLSAEKIVTNYKELWKIEDAFGELKGTLKARPIFHWTDHRIIGHLVVCFLAYLCEAHITRRLREKSITLKSPAIEGRIIKQRQLTVAEALKELVEVRAVPVRVKNQTVWTRTDIAGNAVALLRAVGAAIPPKILKITKNPGYTE
jgi:transposase